MYNTRILWFLAVNFLLLKKYLIMAPLTGSEDLQRNQYSCSMLHQLRPPFNMLSLSKSVRDEITDLGIKKRFGGRGPRGNKSSRKRIMEWKAKWDRNNQVHSHLLRSLSKQTIYDRNSRVWGSKHKIHSEQIQLIFALLYNREPLFLCSD